MLIEGRCRDKLESTLLQVIAKWHSTFFQVVSKWKVVGTTSLNYTNIIQIKLYQKLFSFFTSTTLNPTPVQVGHVPILTPYQLEGVFTIWLKASSGSIPEVQANVCQYQAVSQLNKSIPVI